MALPPRFIERRVILKREIKKMRGDGLLSPLLRRWRANAVKKYLKKLRNSRVLDLGCGNSFVLSIIDKSNRYLGVDFCLEDNLYVNKKNDLVQLANLDLNTQFKKIKGTYDVVLSLAVFEHLEMSDYIIKNVIQKIKKGGLLLVTTPSPPAKKVHNIGSRLLLFGRLANKEHKKLFNKEQLSMFFGDLKLIGYKRFEFGLNQLFVFKKV